MDHEVASISPSGKMLCEVPTVKQMMGQITLPNHSCERKKAVRRSSQQLLPAHKIPRAYAILTTESTSVDIPPIEADKYSSDRVRYSLNFA